MRLVFDEGIFKFFIDICMIKISIHPYIMNNFLHTSDAEGSLNYGVSAGSDCVYSVKTWTIRCCKHQPNGFSGHDL